MLPDFKIVTEEEAKLTAIHTYPVSVLNNLFVCGCHLVLAVYFIGLLIYNYLAAINEKGRGGTMGWGLKRS